MQAAQQQANIELTNAQADLARADADKKRGADTAKTEAETLNITQDIKNKQAAEKLTHIQGEIQELEYLLKGETFQQQKEMIGRELEKLIRTNKVLEGQGKITGVEADNAEEKGRLQLANIALDNILKESQNENVKSNTVKIKEEAAVVFKDYLTRAKNANTNELDVLYRQMESELKRRLQDKGLNQQQEENEWNRLMDIVSTILNVRPRTTISSTSHDSYDDGKGTRTGGSTTINTTR